MADIKFKIEGNKFPFVANVYNNSTLVCTKHIGYSGNSSTSDTEKYRCAIISNLSGDHDYTLTLSDSIGTILHNIVHTACDILPPPPEDKTINACGILSSISTSVDSSGYNHEWQSLTNTNSKELIITPSLKTDESINANFTITTDRSLTSLMNDTNSYVRLYKCCNGATYSLVDSVEGQNTKDISVALQPNDGICYDMYSEIIYSDVAGDYFATSNISLTSISGTNIGNVTCQNTSFDISLSHSIAPTTTAAPEAVNYTVCFNPVTGIDQKTSPICVTPPLSNGAAFNLQIELYGDVATSAIDAIVVANARMMCGSSTYEIGGEYASINTTTTDADLNPPAVFKTITIQNINASNIDDFSAIVGYHVNAYDADKSAISRIRMVGISKVNSADINVYNLSSDLNKRKIEILYSETTTTTFSSQGSGGSGGFNHTTLQEAQ